MSQDRKKYRKVVWPAGPAADAEALKFEFDKFRNQFSTPHDPLKGSGGLSTLRETTGAAQFDVRPCSEKPPASMRKTCLKEGLRHKPKMENKHENKENVTQTIMKIVARRLQKSEK